MEATSCPLSGPVMALTAYAASTLGRTTREPDIASPAPRLDTVAPFPTLPFLFAAAIIFVFAVWVPLFQ